MANASKYHVEKLDISHPDKLKICWALLRPKQAIHYGQVREVLAVAFYIPPKSKLMNTMIDHLLSSIHILLMKYPNAVLMIGGIKTR